MERIIRILAVFGITTLVGLLSIIIADGKLTWATAGLVLLVALTFGFAAGVWAVVHGRFDSATEVGLTVGIVVVAAVAATVLLYAGSEIKALVTELFGHGAAWWLASPILGTLAITFIFGLHRDVRSRR